MRNFIKHDDGTAVFCDKIDGITVISNLVRHPCNLEIVTLKKKKKKKKKSLCPLVALQLIKLLVGLSECNNIRKMLNKNHRGKVPSRAAKS